MHGPAGPDDAPVAAESHHAVHLQDAPRSLDEHRTCSQHPANRVVNISDHGAANVAAELVRELKQAYCQSPIEEEVFDEIADSLVGEGSLDGDG